MTGWGCFCGFALEGGRNSDPVIEREREGERVRAAALLKRKKEMRHNYTVTTTAVNGRKHEEADVSHLVCFSCIAAFQ